MRCSVHVLRSMFAVTMVAVTTSFAASPLLVSRLNATDITRDLPLTDKQQLTSDATGQAKQQWQIKAPKGCDVLGSLEVVGNNQDDALNVGWQCSEFDKSGDRLSPVSPNTFCHKFFVKVLAKIVEQPEMLAKKLIASGEKTHPQAAVKNFGDISVETDGEFFFLRRNPGALGR